MLVVVAAGAIVGRDHFAMQIMRVVVMVAVDGDRARRARAEEPEIFRRFRNLVRATRAADVAVQADDAVGRGHHDMKVVRDQQHGAAVPVADLGDLLVKRDFAGEIDALHGLVENEKLWRGEKRARDQHALELAAGERGDVGVDEVLDAGLGERSGKLGLRQLSGEAHQAAHGHRQGAVELQLLRHIPDAQVGLDNDDALVRLDQAEHELQQCRLAATVRAYHGENFPREQREIDAGENRTAAAAHSHTAELHQRFGARGGRAMDVRMRLVQHWLAIHGGLSATLRVWQARSAFQAGAMKAGYSLSALVFLLTAGSARAEVPNVVASIAPVHSLVASVMQGVGEPTLLIPANVSEHDYALKPSDVRAIANADLMVWVGESLETYLVRPIETEAVANLELIAAPGIDPHPYGEEGGHEHEGHAEADAPDHDAEDGHAHGHIGLDPHVWLDPVRAQAIVNAVADRLAGLDAENAARYRANAEAINAELSALNEEVAAQLAPVAEKPFVTFHDGYSYFVERYGLNQAGEVAVHPERMPGAATVAALRETIATQGVACAFAEPQYDAGAIQSLTGDTQIKVGTLDALGVGLDEGPALYAALIRKNAAAVEACLTPTS